MSDQDLAPGWPAGRLRGLADQVRALFPTLDAEPAEASVDALVATVTADPAGLRAALEAAADRAELAEDAADLEAFLLDELDRVRAHAPAVSCWLEGLDEVAPVDDTYLRAAGMSRFLAEAATLPGALPPPPPPALPAWRRFAPQLGIAASLLAFVAGTQVPRPGMGSLVSPRAPAVRRLRPQVVRPAGWLSEAPEVVTQTSAEDLATVRTRADTGDPQANRDLGLRLLNQPDPDLYQAVDRLRRATLSGDVPARLALAWILSEGPGSVRDEAAAVRLYRDAIAATPASTPGADVPPLFDPGTEATYRLAVLTYEGRGVAGHPTEALELFRRSATAGDTKAMLELSHLYEGDEEHPGDPGRAVDWLRRAAEVLPQAQFELGRRYEEGRGVDRDPRAARRWLARAAAAEEPEALFRLGEVYEAGLGVPVDRKKARRYFHRAAAAGHILAPDRLGGNPLLEEGVEPMTPDVKP